jgi:hypothetical protein
MATSQTIGIDMPEDFPTTAHNAVNVKLGSYQTRAPSMWAEYASGWNAVAIRFKTTTAADAMFTASISRFSRPTHDEYQVQNEELFSFFVNGYATIESFSYALFAMGGLLRPADFSMCIPDQLRAITPSLTRKKYATHFLDTAVEQALSALLDDPTYKEWGYIRNVLAHRTAPSRQYFMSITEGLQGDSTPPDDPDPVWQISGGLPLNEHTTSEKRAWLVRHLTDCVHATVSFVNAQFP